MEFNCLLLIPWCFTGRKPHSVTLTNEGTAISTGAFPCIDDGDYSKKCTYTHTVNGTFINAVETINR